MMKWDDEQASEYSISAVHRMRSSIYSILFST